MAVGISTSINRVAEYFKRHGLAETIKRASLATRRALFANRMVVYCCDLAVMPVKPVNIPESMSIERVRSEGELEAKNRAAITSFWNPDLAQRNIQERFQKSAVLWLIRSGETLAGYGWTIQGRPISPYYFPILPGDVQFFDFLVFPKFRGRAIQWLLTAHILKTLKDEGASRAFADTHEWNQAQLASFKMTAFKPIGKVRTVTLFGRSFAGWSEIETEKPKKISATNGAAPAVVRPHEH
jgi:ribosomal protein S18 acetylase RimI-like enzyme